MPKSRFLNQKLGKRTSRKLELLKSQFQARRPKPASPGKLRFRESLPER